MTVHAHCSERIRLLREALERIDRVVDKYPASVFAVAQAALLADAALSAAPPPDLPLAEGSEWDENEILTPGGVRIGTGTMVSDRSKLVLTRSPKRSHTAAMRWRNLLALARREGLV